MGLYIIAKIWDFDIAITDSNIIKKYLDYFKKSDIQLKITQSKNFDGFSFT